MSNKDLIEFTRSILERYNATPDEWDAFDSVKYSMETTHKISLCYFEKAGEIEATWEDIATGEECGACFRVSKDQGGKLSRLVLPCVYHSACTSK